MMRIDALSAMTVRQPQDAPLLVAGAFPMPSALVRSHVPSRSFSVRLAGRLFSIQPQRLTGGPSFAVLAASAVLPGCLTDWSGVAAGGRAYRRRCLYLLAAI